MQYITGNLGSYQTHNSKGKTWANFSIAIQTAEGTLWTRCSTFSRRAMAALEAAGVGSLIKAGGAVKPTEWADKETGEIKTGTELQTGFVQILRAKRGVAA